MRLVLLALLLLGCGPKKQTTMTLIGPDGTTITTDDLAVGMAALLMEEGLNHLQAGELEQAEHKIGLVASTTPEGWKPEREIGGTLHIAFFDQEQFLARVAWEKSQGLERDLVWDEPSYAEAWFWLGWLAVHHGDFDLAAERLDTALALEPDSPAIMVERSLVLSQQRRYEESLALYERALTARPWITATEKGKALRGSGFQLIELGRLDEAEEAFRQSLEVEDTRLARSELAYIEHLRQGGEPLGGVVVDNPNEDGMGESTQSGQDTKGK